jgi:hypothetical protein
MMAGEGDTTSTETRSPGEIQADIEATREELGDTVEALTEKADVKKQAKRKVDEAKAKVAANQDGFAVIGGVVAVGLLVVWIRRR